MNQKIVAYEIIASKSGKTVADRVNELIGTGWRPEGGLAYNQLTQQYAQAVVQYEETAHG